MKLLLRVVTTAAAFIVPFVTAVYHAEQRGGYEFGTRFHPAWLVAYGALFVVSTFVLGIPAFIERVRHAVLASFAAAVTPLAVASVFFVLYDPRIPRFVVVTTPAILFVVFCVASLVNVTDVRHRGEGDRVLAVLDPEEARTYRRDVEVSRERKFATVSVLDPAELALEGPVSLQRHVESVQANLIVLSEHAQSFEPIVAQAATLHETGTRVRSLASFYDEWLGKLPLTELERTGMWFDIRDLHEQYYPRLKRLMDVVVALLVIPVALVVMPVVMIANWFGNRGPLLFSQERVGHKGRTFRIHKFRSMLPNERVDGRGEWTAENDPRITPVGRLLRRTHLDELPQIFNVLVGDLSIVGPRPEQAHYVHELTEKIPFYGLRHAVRPGMTGWAQVKYPYGSSVADAMEKLQYDLYYLRHQSLTLDVRVCVRTFASILFGKGR